MEKESATKRWRNGVVVTDISARFEPSGRGNHGEVVAEFHRRVENGESRLTLLQEFAERLVWREAGYIAVRYGAMGKKRATGRCFVCREMNGSVRHHVIQVQHGGRNVKSNIVRVCPACHVEIHPWMKSRPKTDLSRE